MAVLTSSPAVYSNSDFFSDYNNVLIRENNPYETYFILSVVPVGQGSGAKKKLTLFFYLSLYVECISLKYLSQFAIAFNLVSLLAWSDFLFSEIIFYILYTGKFQFLTSEDF